ncbi:MAG: ribonuclease P protein component [Gemmatimonas sp.]|nr:ribonuclease P protein component [Gemmatimonas sp.]
MNPRSLTRQKDFQKVYLEGRKLVTRTFVLHLLPAPDDAKAVVASKKVGGAVQRNRAKRLLRHMLQAVFFPGSEATVKKTAWFVDGAGTRSLEDGEAATGLWVVAVGRRPILERNIHDVIADARAALARLDEPDRVEPDRVEPDRTEPDAGRPQQPEGH